MFISKRKIDNKYYFYLEVRIGRKKISIYLGRKDQAKKQLEFAFDSLVQKTAIENFKASKKKYKISCLSLDELLVLERLKIDYVLLKEFFSKEFESFKEDEFLRYAQGSTSVEGNSLSLQEANLVLSKGISISGKKVDEIREVENMKFAAEVSKYLKQINNKNLKKIHSAIMKGFDDKNPGEYRTGPMFITGSSVKPPTAEKVSREMDKLFNWLEKNKDHLHPVELASGFHARFEEIHPFLDGNGRTGREILNVMLQNEDYPRAIINLENRQSYIVLLERIQINKEYKKFSKFIYLCLEKRAEEISKTIEENKEAILKKISVRIKD